ncbi:MAG: hypothetical protein ACRCUY_10285 [Thermoguttaceae bacterium]
MNHIKMHNSVVLFFGTLFLVGCLFAASPSKNGILCDAQSQDGRIKATLEYSPVPCRLSDTITLQIDVEHDPNLEIFFPEFGSAIGNLTILETSEEIVNATTKRLVLKGNPTHGGKTPIWPIVITATDRRGDADQNRLSLVLPSTELDIQASVAPENASLDQITTSKKLFHIYSFAIWWTLVGTICIFGVLFLLWYLRQKQTKIELDSQIRLTPQEIAMERLAQLFASRLHEIDIKKFYIELTGIVRWFIEQQTRIRAPELTTEEFLHEIVGNAGKPQSFSTEMKNRLRLFLESADMVKFAKFRPTQEEIQTGFNRAGEFISEFSDVVAPNGIGEQSN